MQLLLVLLAGLGVALTGPALPAAAESDSFTDPEGDAEGPLDIVLVEHADTADTVSYTLTMAQPFSASDVDTIVWFLDLTVKTPSGDACIFVFQDGPESLAYVLTDCGFPAEKDFGPFPVDHSGDVLSLSVQRPHLDELGLDDDVYSYAVFSLASGDYYSFVDGAPNDPDEVFVHQLSVPPLLPVAGGAIGAVVTDVDGNPVSSLAQGQSFMVGCEPAPCADDGAAGQVSIESTPRTLGNLTADANGDYSGIFRIPTDAAPGAHTIAVETTLNGEPILYSRPITVTAATPSSGPGGSAAQPGSSAILPRSGADVGDQVRWALALLAFGTLFLVAHEVRLRSSRRPCYWEPDGPPY